LTDRNGANNERAMSFGVRGIPTLILYDKFGQEVRRTNGMDADSLINWLRAR